MAIGVADVRTRDGQPGKRLDVTFLLLDGLRRRIAKSQDVVLCALGLGSDGSPQPLSLRIVPQETEQAWAELLQGLKRRGVGQGLLLICCDDHPALVKAAGIAFPVVPIQISVAHRLLALARKVDPPWRAACLAEARQIFAAPDQDTAVARFRAWRANWMKLGPRIVGSLEVDLASCLMFHRFPSDLWPKIRTVNLVERVFREARRDPQPGLPEAMRDWEDVAGLEEALEAAIEIPAETPAVVESSLPAQPPAPAGLPAPAEPPVPPELPVSATLHPPAGVPADESPLPAQRPDLCEPPASAGVSVVVEPPAPPVPAVLKAWPSFVDYPRAPGTHAVHLNRDPGLMWWLGQYRQTHTRQSRAIFVVMVLVGLMAGLILARSL